MIKRWAMGATAMFKRKFIVCKDVERAVTVEEGMALAKKHDCLFYEFSARTRANIQQCFKDLSLKTHTTLIFENDDMIRSNPHKKKGGFIRSDGKQIRRTWLRKCGKDSGGIKKGGTHPNKPANCLLFQGSSVRNDVTTDSLDNNYMENI